MTEIKVGDRVEGEFYIDQSFHIFRGKVKIVFSDKVQVIWDASLVTGYNLPNNVVEKKLVTKI